MATRSRGSWHETEVSPSKKSKESRRSRFLIMLLKTLLLTSHFTFTAANGHQDTTGLSDFLTKDELLIGRRIADRYAIDSGQYNNNGSDNEAGGFDRYKRQLPTEINIQDLAFVKTDKVADSTDNNETDKESIDGPKYDENLWRTQPQQAVVNEDGLTLYRKRRQTIQEISFVPKTLIGKRVMFRRSAIIAVDDVNNSDYDNFGIIVFNRTTTTTTLQKRHRRQYRSKTDEKQAQATVMSTTNGTEAAGRSRKRRQIVEVVSIPPVTAPLFSSRLFDYGPDEGDAEVPASIDVGKRVKLSYPLTFYGKEYRTIYILSNGGIGFEPSARNFKTNIFPDGKKVIAPFWNRNDLRKGGHIFYRELKEGVRVLERGQSEIRYQYDKQVKAKAGLLVTWVNMQPLGDEVLPDDNTNTFQVLLLFTNNGTYANFIYKNIGWTQGARAGFNKGSGNEFYELPTSGTGNIMYLEEYGNTGIPGEWIFEIDMDSVVRCKPGTKGDTCDRSCDKSEWGYDCSGCCHCGDGGKCNAVTGECQGGDGQCAECWDGFPKCQNRKTSCRLPSESCAHNAISFTDRDRCGVPVVRCQCLAGYTGDGHKLCTDMDECAVDDKSPCHPNAECVNTPGRFYCECSEGYTGDGYQQCTELGAERTLVQKEENEGGVGGQNRNPATGGVFDPFNANSINSNNNNNQNQNFLLGAAIQNIQNNNNDNNNIGNVNRNTNNNDKNKNGGVGQFQIPPLPQRVATTPASIQRQQYHNIPQEAFAAFLYPYSEHQSMPKRKDTKVAWELRLPLKIFGKMRNRLLVSGRGIIAVTDLPVQFDDPIEAGVQGFAPFFGGINLEKGGNIFVDESSDTNVLTRATQTVQDLYGEKDFIAKSVVSVTFDNVTTRTGNPGNTFQANVIGGGMSAGGRKAATFVEYLYKDLKWSNGAEASIMPEDIASTLVLPGSQTEDLVQLTELSNVQKPGQWLWRVDDNFVDACPQPDLRPPYCDVQKQATQRTRRPPPPPRPVPRLQTASSLPTSLSRERIPVQPPRTIQPVFEPAPPGSRRREPPQTASPPSRLSISRVGDGETVTFPPFITVIPSLFTPSQNVVAIRDRGRQGGRQSPTQSVRRPSSNGRNGPNIILPSQISGGGRPRPVIQQTQARTEPVATQTRTVNQPRPVLSRARTPSPNAGIIVPPRSVPSSVPSHNPNRTQRPPTGFRRDPQTDRPPPIIRQQTVRPTPPPQRFTPRLPVVRTQGPTNLLRSGVNQISDGRLPVGRPPQPEIIFDNGGQQTTPPPTAQLIPQTRQPPPTSVPIIPFNNQPADEDLQNINPEVANGSEQGDNTFLPIQIFTTPKRTSRRPTRPPVFVTATSPRPSNPFRPRRPPGVDPFNRNRLGRRRYDLDEDEDLNSPSKLAIIIPTGIVGVWLLLLLVIGLVVCCRKRKSRKRLQSTYDPSYHFRQAPAVAAYPNNGGGAGATTPGKSGDSRKYPPSMHTSYEDHLEKAARVSDMSQYGNQQQNGRLYGSYWNMSGGDGGGGVGRNAQQTASNNNSYSYYNQGYYGSCSDVNGVAGYPAVAYGRY